MIKYTYDDILEYKPDLIKYVKSRVNSDWWKDIVQDILLYLYIKYESLIITNLKGLIINTAKMFINTFFRNHKNTETLDSVKYCYSGHLKPVIEIDGYNVCNITDNILKSLRCVPNVFLTTFKLKYVDDFSIKEIAYKLSTTENTIKTRIYRCKQYFKNNK